MRLRWVTADSITHPLRVAKVKLAKNEGGGLRSYGSMTYAGLKSMIYAGLSADDPRVVAAMTFIRKNYSLESNPGMGHAGLFYYYHTFAKALDAADIEILDDESGTPHVWRTELAKTLMDLQQEDGSWVNSSNARWMEGEPPTGHRLCPAGPGLLQDENPNSRQLSGRQPWKTAALKTAALMNDPVPQAKGKLQYVVRCGSMRSLGVMDAGSPYRYGDEVVVKSTRGTEMGTVLCEATAAAVDHLEEPTEGRILRSQSATDRTQWKHLEGLVARDTVQAQACIDALGLTMELVDVERILGGEKMVVYFLSDGRVDFRQLVRDLAKQFQTRIEMRQIGVRDEAKLMADYGDCGQPICCARFLSKMPPVSMKMAKLQKATLDPAKISGRCGRLKCCLRLRVRNLRIPGQRTATDRQPDLDPAGQCDRDGARHFGKTIGGAYG